MPGKVTILRASVRNPDAAARRSPRLPIVFHGHRLPVWDADAAGRPPGHLPGLGWPWDRPPGRRWPPLLAGSDWTSPTTVSSAASQFCRSVRPDDFLGVKLWSPSGIHT